MAPCWLDLVSWEVVTLGLLMRHCSHGVENKPDKNSGDFHLSGFSGGPGAWGIPLMVKDKLLYLAPHYNPKKKKKRHNTQGPLQVLEATCSLSGCATQAQYQVTWKAADFEQGPNKRTLQQIQGCCASSSATWAVWPSRCSGAGSMSGDRDTAGGFVRPLQVTHTTNLWFRSNALPFSVDNFFHFKK